MIVEGGRIKCNWGLQLGIIIFNWLAGSIGGLLFFSIVFLSTTAVKGQNCDVDFPGTSNQINSNTCGGSTDGMNLGKSIFMDDNDIFTFDAPSVINIQGNLTVSAQGNGTIVIPLGVTVIVDGNFQLDAKNGGCLESNQCVFTIVVYGTLQVNGSLQNNLVELVWEGLGTVYVVNKLENTSNGCMYCGLTCPQFPDGPGGCEDSGTACSANFCTNIYGVNCLIDIFDPMISDCPGDQLVSTGVSSCDAIVSWNPPKPLDNCGIASFTSSHKPGDIFPLGITTVTYTATDKNGNAANCTFKVEVVDSAAPVITGCPNDITVSPMDCDQVSVNWTPPTASDNCKLITLNSTHNPGEFFTLGETTVTYTALDEEGIFSTCSFQINVVDNQAPIISNCPADLVVTTEIDPLNKSAAVSWKEPEATDNCTLNSLTSTHQPGEIFAEGQTVVTYTALDGAGNMQTCSFAVVVKDNGTLIKDNLVIYKAFSPNGDGINDRWNIGDIEQFPDNSVTVFDRWGGIIFQASGYNNENIVWDGTENSSRMSGGEVVPAGTYFYSMRIQGMGSINGYVELVK